MTASHEVELRNLIELGNVENTENEPRRGVSQKLCEARSECHVRNRTEKGLEYDLEVASKKRALKDLKLRISTANTSLKEQKDFIKLRFLKDSLEADLNNFNTIHENVTDLLIRLELVDTEHTTHDEYTITNDAAMECLADLKGNIKDLELEHAELLSQRSPDPKNRTQISLAARAQQHPLSSPQLKP